MRPMKKMRLQPASPRPKMLPLLKSGAGAISRDVTRRRCFLAYVQPTDLMNEATKAASRKAALSVRDLLIRSFLAGGLLAYATSLVFIVLSQGIAPIVGAILFPVGFVILALLGLELATGNFALLPVGWAAGEVPFSAVGCPRNCAEATDVGNRTRRKLASRRWRSGGKEGSR